MLRGMFAILLLLTAGASAKAADPLTLSEFLQKVRPVKADARIAYGQGQSQWIDFYKPKSGGLFPVVILVHGGCWDARVPAESASPMAADIAAHGVAVWNIEYRRIGEPGGGYPGMFQDVAAAVDRLETEAGPRKLDLKRVVAVGHSAGGLLALWAASRPKLPASSPLYVKDSLRIRTAVAIAGIGDLRANAGWLPLTCRNLPSLEPLIGARTAERPDPFADTSPRELLPTGVKTVWIVGAYDDNYPPYMSLAWRQAARASGDRAETTLLPGAGHFDVAEVHSPAWAIVRNRILAEVRSLESK